MICRGAILSTANAALTGLWWDLWFRGEWLATKAIAMACLQLCVCVYSVDLLKRLHCNQEHSQRVKGSTAQLFIFQLTLVNILFYSQLLLAAE